MHSDDNSRATTGCFRLHSKYKNNMQPHNRKYGEIACIAITLIITLGNPIQINSSMEGVASAHAPTETVLRHTKYTQHVLNVRANQF